MTSLLPTFFSALHTSPWNPDTACTAFSFPTFPITFKTPGKPKAVLCHQEIEDTFQSGCKTEGQAVVRSVHWLLFPLLWPNLWQEATCESESLFCHIVQEGMHSVMLGNMKCQETLCQHPGREWWTLVSWSLFSSSFYLGPQFTTWCYPH